MPIVKLILFNERELVRCRGPEAPSNYNNCHAKQNSVLSAAELRTWQSKIQNRSRLGLTVMFSSLAQLLQVRAVTESCVCSAQ